MADPEVPRSAKALSLGRLLDAHHPATDLIQPPPNMGTCDVCGSQMYIPDEVLMHWPSKGEFSRVQDWLEDHPPVAP